MRVLFVSPSFAPAYAYGGPVVTSLQLCRHLARLGHEVRVLTTDAAGGGARLQGYGGTVRTMDGFAIRYCRRVGGEDASPGLLARLAGAIRWADVVLLNAVFSAPTPPVFALCAALDRPLLWFPRGSLQTPWTEMGAGKRIWVRMLRLLAPRRLRMVYSSTEEAESSAWAFRGSPWCLTPHGVDVPESPAVGKGGGPIRLVFLGRLHPIKGLPLLFEAMALARRGGAEVELRVIGEGAEEYMSQLREQARADGLADVVAFAGPVYDEAEKLRLLDDCDLGVLISENENFGNAAAEMLAAGLPVLVSANLPWTEVAGRECGFVVARTAEAIARQLSRLNRDELRRHGARGREWMAERSWLVAAKALEAEMQRAREAA